MTVSSDPARLSPFEEAATELERAVEAKKCWPCGCFHEAIEAIERAMEVDARPPKLATAMALGTQRITARRYECLGCEVCFPANALNALAASGTGIDVDPCPTRPPEQREGWPPLPGDYLVLRYYAPVAVCVLHSADIVDRLAASGEVGVSIIGTLHTENLGIERMITNVLANPNIRFLLLCGDDSKQAVGHLPGQSLAALARAGIDERGRIVGATGRRPVIKNINRDAVDHFRRTVEVVDLIGEEQDATIRAAIASCRGRDPGPAEPFGGLQSIQKTLGRLPERMIPDAAGYFVVFADRARDVLLLEHYGRDGVLDTVIEGRSAAELYTPAIEGNLISRLDHAAYLGRELARAEAALAAREPYVQDGAPERGLDEPADRSCGCHSPCEERKQ